ncbi:helix-turn-helix transcriptional regulator [Enterococcus sp. DIV1298c]|uniref:Rgg family transcriptional regulator n=1 Tax=Enterococcus sp. DIV1298c TaxID=2815328 RepID=UPI001A92B304|nr:helix-turn-helix transcriptional regulator [Enterococcus sp. DIV1298c]
MKSYGKTIKEIRKAKGMLQKELVDEQLSISLLSQFENGRLSMSCERFHLLLSKLEVKFEEFIVLHSESPYSPVHVAISKYMRATNVASLKELEKLQENYEELLAYYHENYSLELDHFLQIIRFNYETKKSYFKGVPMHEASLMHSHLLDSAKQYLADTTTWGVYELKLFSRIAVSLEPEVLWKYVKMANDKSERFEKVPGNKDILYQTFITIFSVFCLFGEVDYATKLFSLWKSRVIKDEHIEQAVLLPFYEGCLALLNQEEEQAIQLMDRTLTTLETLGLSKIAHDYSELKKVLTVLGFVTVIIIDPLFEDLIKY